MIGPENTRIAFFGGACSEAAIDAVCRLADAGYDIVCADHDPRESVELREAGVPIVHSRLEAVEDSQVVLTSCRTPDDVEDLYLGEDGLLELMSPGTCAIDLSVSSPSLAREIQAVAAISEIDVLDAPLLNLGEKEQACAFVGATPELQEQYAPLFPYLATNVFPQNAAGEGQFAAMLACIGLAGSIMGAVEATSLSRIAGFPESSALNVLAATSAGSRALVDYIPRSLGHDFGGRFKVSEFMGALKVALDTAESLDITIPMVETAYQLYELLSTVGGDELNIQALSLLYEDEQTCAEYGLNWELADRIGDDDEEDDDDGFNLEDFFRGGGDGPHPGGNGGPDDSIPPFSGFFSKN